VAVVATSIFRRTGYKYRDRAYRYVTADTGHLLENLRVAAQAAGMHARLEARFDETRLARTVGVDGIEEGVLAVMGLRRAQDAQPAPGARFVTQPIGPKTALGLTGTVQQATSLLQAAGSMPAAGTALPPPQEAAMPVRRAITERRSQRRFSVDPVPLAALSSILADMAQPPQLSDAVRIHLVVNRVDGLAPGVYRYTGPHMLEKVRSGDFAAAAQSAALSQEVIGGAAVVLILSAEREPMLGQGARGYRQGFLEAGMIGERWLLGAVARGLAACPVGAFYDDEAAALIGVDRQRQWVLHFAALGMPAGREAR
jgi:SagB-type dehydrogenase family enzyme